MRILLSTLVFAGSLMAQYPGLSLPPNGDQQRAQTGQAIGPIQVSIDYCPSLGGLKPSPSGDGFQRVRAG